MERLPSFSVVRTAAALRGLAILVLAIAAAGCASARGAGGGDGGGGSDAGSNGVDASMAPDGAADANTCAMQPCSLTPQCGCGSGMACYLDGTSTSTTTVTVCNAAGAGTETSTCTGSSGCAPGYDCFGGRCLRWCATDTDCPGAGGLCIVHIIDGNQNNIPGAITCTTDCDPTSSAPTACPATWACHIYQDTTTMALLTDCDPAPASGGGKGALCDTNGNRDCAPGLDCIALTQGGTTTNECLQSCVCPGGNCAAGTCTLGGSCNGFQTPAVIGGTTYGTCF
jgi:hypothetical protein